MTTKRVKPICDPEKETDVKKKQTYSYSQKSCIKKCLSDEIIRQCHCAGTQFLLDMKTCSADNETEVKLNSFFFIRTTTYNHVTSTVVWPAKKYLPSFLEELFRVRHKVIDLLKNISDITQYSRKNFLRINIFFQELQEKKTLQRHSYGIAKLLSDIGGQLGLWVGVSVMTLPDFAKALTKSIQAFYRWIKKNIVKKRYSFFHLAPPENCLNEKEQQSSSTNDWPTVYSTGSVTIQTSPSVSQEHLKQ
ncbi:amiloride-sensitive sodium channel subunit beta-like [Xenia sp. Carnegie-2017]|uniref:amiloride-sensitive sodium channel subunit beta-like n=1 Tax=Xenia sp. Carnegie-2017 TaxID=2897299 RepID=UPI001F046539|nr:amiloride-sensitive sodium channel subunit beta-like [Xenia sp. Carnegie-2017]